MSQDGDRVVRREMNRWNNRTAMAVTFTRCRERAGLTRQQLAEASGVPLGLIEEMERGERDALSNDQTDALAAAMNTTWAAINMAARSAARAMREDQ